MKTKIFYNIVEIKSYYIEKTNTYDFTDFDLVEFEFDLKVDSNIKALNINALNINAYNINADNIQARNINAWDIDAWDIDALDIKVLDINAIDIYAWNIDANNIVAKDISYYAFCIAYKNIKCSSIKGRRNNCKHFVLDGKIEVIKE